MTLIGDTASAPGAAPLADLIKGGTGPSFAADVLDASRDVPGMGMPIGPFLPPPESGLHAPVLVVPVRPSPSTLWLVSGT